MSAITNNLIKLIIQEQRAEQAVLLNDYIERDYQDKLAKLAINKEIIVMQGVRRAGKSVLLHYIRKQAPIADYYFNFEDERLVEFTVADFQILHAAFIELFDDQRTFFFDEIQNIPGWEMFVRRLYNSGYKIYLTSSNANLFSEELGTRLTGRYIPIDIYPLSFMEFVRYKGFEVAASDVLTTTQMGKLKKLFNQYCICGGIPEYTKFQNQDYLHALYNSIIYRDIIVRYRLTNSDVIVKLLFYLASNCSKEVTYNSLRKMLGTGSTTTISEYCRYLENSYLCFFVNSYNDSVKAQLQSAKKVYFVDHAIAKTIGFRVSEDYGRMLENIVFMQLKRNFTEIYYHKQKKECDFIVKKDNRVVCAIQVCRELTEKTTKQREIAGLLEAMERFSLSSGVIVTEDTSFVEKVKLHNKHFTITAVPIWRWLLD